MKPCCWLAGLIIAVVALDSCARSSSIDGHSAHADGDSGSGSTVIDDDVTMLQVMTERKSRSELRRAREPIVEASSVDENVGQEHQTPPKQEGENQEVAPEDANQAPGLMAEDVIRKMVEDVTGKPISRGTPGSRQARQNERRRKRKTRPLSPPPVNWVHDWAADPNLKDYTLVLDHLFYVSLGAQRGDEAVQSIMPSLACCGYTIGMCAIAWILCYSVSSTDKEATMLKLILQCSCFGLCCWGVTVVNKSLVAATSTPTLVMAAQMFVTVVGLYLFARDKLMGSKEAVFKWLAVPLLSSGMLVTSFFTYRYISLSTLMITRSVGPLIVAPIESVVMAEETRPHVSCQMIFALLICFASAFMYCKTVTVSLEGFGFALLNLALACAERLMQRRFLTDECKALSTESCMYLNSIVGMLPALILGACLGEFGRLDRKVWFGSMTTVLLIISGVLVSAVSYLALALQREIHATSFLVLQNAVRVVVAALGVLVLFHPIGWPLQALSLFFSFLGAMWYAKSQIDAVKAKQKALAEKLATPRDFAAALFLAGAREPMPRGWRNVL